MAEPKFHSFMFILYDEPQYRAPSLPGKVLTGCELANFLHGVYGQNFAYIYHDNDILPDGTIKKAHWHCIVYFQNARTYNAFSKELFHYYTVDRMVVKPWDNWNKCCRYLVHADDPDKFQYPVQNVTCSFDFLQVISSPPGEDGAMKLIRDKIMSNQITTFDSLVLFGINNNCYSTVRRNTYIIAQLLDEAAKIRRDAFFASQTGDVDD